MSSGVPDEGHIISPKVVTSIYPNSDYYSGQWRVPSGHGQIQGSPYSADWIREVRVGVVN